VSDTRTLCAFCGIWQCLARHGGGTCHAVNGPADVSCGACYANRPTIQRDLTVASEEPPACRQRAVSLHPRLRLSYACVLTAGHNGECAPGGTCVEHGPYIGKPGTTPRCPKCPSATITFVPAAVASPQQFGMHCIPEADGSFGYEPSQVSAYVDACSERDSLKEENARLAGQNAELRKDAERWQYFRRFLSVERDRYTPTQYVVADVNLIIETTVREGVNHTVELLVDAARFFAGATGDRE
jgi:hypothetical protein